MKKRLAMVLSMVMAVVSLASCGKQEATEGGEKVFNIGVTQFADHPSLDNCREGFIEGLKSEGFEEGKNIKIDFKSAAADMAMNTQIAQTFAANDMDLVCGIATPSAQAVYASCLEKKIPVIFNAVSDPVAAQLAKSETEPLPGITGVSDQLPVTQQLELIREMLPDAKTIGILYTTSEANSISTLQIYEKEASNYGFTIESIGVGSEAEVAQATDILLEKVDCISNMTDNTVVAALAVVIDKANAKNIPVFGSEEEQVKNGCVACAGLDYLSLGKMAGVMAARVLKGEAIETIPYETVKDASITVNSDVISKLGINYAIEDNINVVTTNK